MALILTGAACVVLVGLLQWQLDATLENPSGYILPDFEFTSKIRDDVANEADWGTSRTQLKSRIFTNSIAEIEKMFKNDEGAIMCQGVAYYLHLKYLEAGYKSYLVGFRSNVFSHAMTLVQVVRQDGSNALIVQDPTFNLSYVDRQGKPLSIFQIMELLGEGRDEDVIVKRGDPPVVEFLRSPADKDPSAGIYVKNLVGPSEENPNFLIYRATISLDEFSDAVDNRLSDFCAQRGVRKNLLYAIFDQPLYVYKRYPMNDEEKSEADALFNEIDDLYRRLHPGESP